MPILALDSTGSPRQWISKETAITYHATDSVIWGMGEIIAAYHGGTQRDGKLSYIESSSIIAIKGNGFNPHKHSKVTLTNRTLFGRDRNICAYCGIYVSNHYQLSRDHIVPKSRSGENSWMNAVTSCMPCNGRKGNKTLKECGMQLLYLPYVPSHHENMILQNRNILACQMDFLLSGVPKYSRIRLN